MGMQVSIFGRQESREQTRHYGQFNVIIFSRSFLFNFFFFLTRCSCVYISFRLIEHALYNGKNNNVTRCNIALTL